MTQKAEIRARVGELLVDLIEKNGLSNKKLGEIMGCGRNTINNYRRLNTTPNSNFINKLAELFDVNLTWLYTGDGEMYRGDGLGPGKNAHVADDYEMDLEEPQEFENVETGMDIPGEDESPMQNVQITAALEKAARILESESSYSNVLIMNIEHLERALNATKNYGEMYEELNQLQSDVISLQKKLNLLNGASSKPKTPVKKKAVTKKVVKKKPVTKRAVKKKPVTKKVVKKKPVTKKAVKKKPVTKRAVKKKSVTKKVVKKKPVTKRAVKKKLVKKKVVRKTRKKS